MFYGEERMKSREDKRMIKLYFFFPSKWPLLGICKKISTFTLNAWSFLLVHIRFTPSEGPKDFANWFSKNSDHKRWTTKSDHGIRPSSVVRFHGPWWKPNPAFREKHVEYILNYSFFLSFLKLFKKKPGKRWSQHVASRTWEHDDCERLCPNISLGTAFEDLHSEWNANKSWGSPSNLRRNSSMPIMGVRKVAIVV